MFLGALIDAGVPLTYIKSELEKLNLGKYEIINHGVNKCGIAANYFNVLLEDEMHDHENSNDTIVVHEHIDKITDNKIPSENLSKHHHDEHDVHVHHNKEIGRAHV